MIDYMAHKEIFRVSEDNPMYSDKSHEFKVALGTKLYNLSTNLDNTPKFVQLSLYVLDDNRKPILRPLYISGILKNVSDSGTTAPELLSFQTNSENKLFKLIYEKSTSAVKRNLLDHILKNEGGEFKIKSRSKSPNANVYFYRDPLIYGSN
jgi:hypothetical protein